ncbi:unnamed protein product [Anisakis simplex]|uniref:EGF-like domain-containing protein n=1 Tax=Anisakis simplex TaxID=6269 RepID=A0A0M3K0G6_ANISI|nr:unnamed protein product [Anisakis simplex]
MFGFIRLIGYVKLIECLSLGHARYRRQSLDASHTPQIDLNITVPYIFSARLYPYGKQKGDQLLTGSVQSLKLSAPINFLGQKYEKLYIRRDGSIAFSSRSVKPSKLPTKEPIIAVYWMPSEGGNVHYRETTEQSVLNLAQNEVNIQYRYGSSFKPHSVVVVTWENTHDRSDKSSEGNLFQIALIYSESGTFAHVVYSKLISNNDAIAGFSGQDDHYSLPESGTHDAIQLAEKSDIGIPGEFVFRIDADRVFLCGAGFKGLECIDACGTTEWGLDCSRECHCEGGSQCNAETGICANGRCNPGWTGEPICDDGNEVENIDECAAASKDLCPPEQPDCLNTPGAFLCLCFEYDNATKTCKGSPPLEKPSESEQIPVKVVPLQPVLIANTQQPLTVTLTIPTEPASTETSIASSASTSTPSAPETAASPSESAELSSLMTAETFRSTTPDVTVESKSQSPTSESSTTQQQTTPSTTQFEATTQSPSVTDPTTSATTKAISTTTSSPSSQTIRFSPVTIRPVFGTTSSPCKCGQNAECISGVCQCKQGWTGDGQLCTDINECFGEPSICGPHSICENSAGSYTCQCDIGYIFDNEGKCVDMDECAEGVVVCGDGKNSSVCVNTDGAYECRCAPGYVGHPDTQHGCNDIDECQLSDFYCGEKGVCKNTIGSYECECSEGYQQDVEGGQCVDIDECKYDPCDKAALCTNLPGTFKCTCIDGFIGNGIECHETIMYPIENPNLVLQSVMNSLGELELQIPIALFGNLYRNLFSVMNSLGELELQIPIALFGNLYRNLFIISNGAVSFGSPLKLLSKDPPEFPAFVPLYQQYDLQRGGNIFVKVINEDDALNYALLTRSSLMVQDRFHEREFRTRSLIIISFDKLIQFETDQLNTFQVVIAQGMNATFLTYLYEEVECDNAVSGFSSGGEFFELPFELLMNSSNIGEKGKWMFRVDQKEPVRCPAGTLNPPLCQKECAAGKWGFSCHNDCHCANNIPCDFSTGFCSNARCAEGWSGINCFEDQPECICNDGYHGDGFSCQLIERLLERPSEPTDEDEPKVITDGIPLSIPGKIGREEGFDETPFLASNWITEKSSPEVTSRSTKKPFVTPSEPIAKDYNDIENEVLIGGRTMDDDTDNASCAFFFRPIF